MVEISDQKFAYNEREKNRNLDKSKNYLKMNSLEQSVCWLCTYQVDLDRKRSLILMRVLRSLMI